MNIHGEGKCLYYSSDVHLILSFVQGLAGERGEQGSPGPTGFQVCALIFARGKLNSHLLIKLG